MWLDELLKRRGRAKAMPVVQNQVVATQPINGPSAIALVPASISRYKVTSVVAEGMTVKGSVETDESLMVSGTVDGDVRVTGSGMAVLCRQRGRIRGSISAELVMVAGEVEGNITAHFVRLYPTAKVSGKIVARRLIADEAAVMNTALPGPSSEAKAEVTPVGDPAPEDEGHGESVLAASFGARSMPAAQPQPARRPQPMRAEAVVALVAGRVR